MVLVLFFFVSVILFGFIFSKVRFCLNKLEIDNTQKDMQTIRKLDIRIKIYWFGLIKLICIKFDERILKKFTFEDFINNKMNEKVVKNVSIKDIKTLKLKLEELKFYSSIGTEDVIITSILIFIISNVITYIVSKNIAKNSTKKYSYAINPCYKNKNIFIFDISCIISMKTVHIINMLVRFVKRSVYKDGRTSNRKLNDYSYE